MQHRCFLPFSTTREGEREKKIFLSLSSLIVHRIRCGLDGYLWVARRGKKRGTFLSRKEITPISIRELTAEKRMNNIRLVLHRWALFWLANLCARCIETRTVVSVEQRASRRCDVLLKLTRLLDGFRISLHLDRCDHLLDFDSSTRALTCLINTNSTTIPFFHLRCTYIHRHLLPICVYLGKSRRWH